MLGSSNSALLPKRHIAKIKIGPVRELNPGPLAPEARIIPLDQPATYEFGMCFVKILLFLKR